MAENQQQEIPQEIRELALQNIDQARAAYSQLMDAARKALEMMKTIVPSHPMAGGLNEVQERAMRFTQQNLDAISQWPMSLPRQRGTANPEQTCTVADARLCASSAGVWQLDE